MDSREICIWTDQRWYRALSVQLEKQGATIEQQLSEYFEAMLKQLPAQEYEQISREIQQEDQRQREAQEASRKFAAFHVREQGREEYFRLEPPLDALGTARLMRSYIRKEPRTAAKSFAGLLPNRTPVTAEEFDQMMAVHFENPDQVTGAFDLDFDKGEFSIAHDEDGWRTFSMRDVSTAAYHAYRAEYGVSMEHRRSRFAHKLVGKELTSAGHLSAKQITFAEEISEIDGRLNFYLETDFDVDAMFGTCVCTEENDDCLNVYADYDMASGQVCGELEVDLHRADGREESVPYHLNAAEKAVLLREMEAYCLEQTGMTLKDYSAQQMAEDMEPPIGPSM